MKEEIYTNGFPFIKVQYSVKQRGCVRSGKAKLIPSSLTTSTCLVSEKKKNLLGKIDSQNVINYINYITTNMSENLWLSQSGLIKTFERRKNNLCRYNQIKKTNERCTEILTDQKFKPTSYTFLYIFNY